MRYFLFFVLALYSLATFAGKDVYNDCVLNSILNAGDLLLANDVARKCKDVVESISFESVKNGAASKRLLSEQQTQWNRHSITAHKQNYILPYSYSPKVNREAYRFSGDWSDSLKHYESKFQLSIKVPLTSKGIFGHTDAIYGGLTIQSWWQVFSSELSSPFRETNYQPEIFYLTGLNWHPFDGNMGLIVGLEHQSNGRAQVLSRSWNRVYTTFIFEKDNLVLSLRPWYRLKEEDKATPGDSDGDDNPDIEKFMGHFDLRGVYKWHNHELSLMGRHNLRSDTKGAFELGWSFPLSGHLKGYVQYFKGYGESLIDYNHNTERFGIGILLTDIL